LAAGRRSAGWLFATMLLVIGAWVACGGSGGGGGGGLSPPPTSGVVLSSTNLTFASLGVGINSPAQGVTMSNNGTASLSISGMAIGGANASDFSQINNCGSSLAAGGICLIDVTFTPAAMGSRSASLIINDSASGSPQAISMSGTGVGAPAVTLSPPTLAFGNQLLGSVSAQLPVTLTNTGIATLSITGGTIVPANETTFNVYDACNLTPILSPGGSCQILVSFGPANAGPLSAGLSITDNAPGSPQTLTFTGTGALPPTPPGTYSIQVGAVNGNDQHYLNVPVYVQ
jgi:trimeric autotransporter adhesin